MVLVAAIAAGVLIDTAGSLQSRAERTGHDSVVQVSNRLIVTNGFANVTDAGTVDHVNLTIMLAPGSGSVNVTKATINYVGPSGASVSPIESIDDDDRDVLIEQSDRGLLHIDTSESHGGKGLLPGDEVSITVTTQAGSSTHYRIGIPHSLTDKSVVAV